MYNKKNILYIILIAVLIYLFKIMIKYFKKEKIEFFKNEFIINDKYPYNIMDNDFNLIIYKMEIVIEKHLKYSAFVNLKLKIKNEFNVNQINDIENSFKILKKLKKYNKPLFYDIKNKYFKNEFLFQMLESEIENA